MCIYINTEYWPEHSDFDILFKNKRSLKRDFLKLRLHSVQFQ